MGNEISTQTPDIDEQKRKDKPAYVEFLASAGKTIGQASGAVCGSLNDTFQEEEEQTRTNRPSHLKPQTSEFMNPENDDQLQSNPMSQLFARALLNEVTDNPSTMTPVKMAEREKKLLRAKQRANSTSRQGMRAIGARGDLRSQIEATSQRMIPSNILSEHKAQQTEMEEHFGKHTVTIGLMMSRKDVHGHPDTVTRQTAFDFNELQDRDYNYVSSTSTEGWRAGGGEKGGVSVVQQQNDSLTNSHSSEPDFDTLGKPMGQKIPQPDLVHVPIIHIDCESEAAVNGVIAALARGEVFIPHMNIMPEAIGVNGISPPDLVVRFGCERNEDFPPEEWSNWCLEFMHNQLYEYFEDAGARWMKRPFQMTLAKKVRWKTVKHMNKFFAHSETVINSWRENGPQYLDPHPAHIDGGATPEEVNRPHGIYLLRNGKPTNYFAPNFDPPYTTKMTRSLLQNVIAKSWDKKKRDWSTAPVTSVTPSLLFSTMCGCAEPNQGGFIAREATNHFSPVAGGSFFSDSTNDLAMNTSIQSERKLMNDKIMQNEAMRKHTIGHQQEQKNFSAASPARDNSSVGSRRTESSAEDSHDYTRDMSGYLQSPMNNQSPMRESPYSDSKYGMSPNDQLKNPLKERNVTSATTKTPQVNNTHADNPKDPYDIFNGLNDDDPSPEKPIAEVDNSDHQRNVNNVSPVEGGQRQHSTNMSVAESQTTVPTMNRSSKLIEQERERRKLREVEREKERKKIDELELAIQKKLRLHEARKKQDMGMDPDPEPESPMLSDAEAKKKKKLEKKAAKKEKKRLKKERKERERSRSVQRSSEEDIWNSMSGAVGKENHENQRLATDPVNSMSPGTSGHNGRRTIDGNVHSSHDSSYFPVNLNGTASPKKRQNVFVPNSPASSNNMEISSTPSMDYSLDTASLLGDGSLVGGQFAGDASVVTMGTNATEDKSLLSYVTRSTVHDVNNRFQKRKEEAMKQPSSEDDISLSLMASTSTGGGYDDEEVPSDEDLFAIGWAKALDPSSNCYYYFTLDRKKTVWENPLAETQAI